MSVAPLFFGNDGEMDTTLLVARCQPLDQGYQEQRWAELMRRGYSKSEVIEIHRRAMAWLEENFDRHPVTGELFVFRRHYSVALAEVLADGADIALGHFA
jgi:hypothetical protein